MSAPLGGVVYLPPELFDQIARHADIPTLINLLCSCSHVHRNILSNTVTQVVISRWGSAAALKADPSPPASPRPVLGSGPAREQDKFLGTSRGRTWASEMLRLIFCSRFRSGLEFLFVHAPMSSKTWKTVGLAFLYRSASDGWLDGLTFFVEKVGISPCTGLSSEHWDRIPIGGLGRAGRPWSAALLASQFDAFVYLDGIHGSVCPDAKSCRTSCFQRQVPCYALVNDWTWARSCPTFDVSRWEEDTMKLFDYCLAKWIEAGSYTEDREACVQYINNAVESGSLRLVKYILGRTPPQWIPPITTIFMNSTGVINPPSVLPLFMLKLINIAEWRRLQSLILAHLLDLASVNVGENTGMGFDDLWMTAFKIVYAAPTPDLLQAMVNHQPHDVSPLIEKASGSLPIVKFLNDKCKTDLSPYLHDIACWASKTCNDRCERLIYLHKTLGYDVSSRNDKLLIECAKAGDVESLEYLRSVGVDVRTQDDKAFVMAVRSRSGFAAVRWLLKAGADIGAQNGRAIRAVRSRADYLHMSTYNFIAEELGPNISIDEDVDIILEKLRKFSG
ncbi:hypothetical protein HKX48_000045 [Thoreauomyces humboldtii]|nr:hypothetical protein HKX48_000045 [Thoreauomyces humboldtii]